MAELKPITSEQLAEADAANKGGAYVPDRLRVDATPVDDAPAANYTVAGIFAIVAFILFAVTLALLVQDWNFLKVA